MAHSSIPVDETILGNPANEETDTLQYWIQASAYLLNFVSADPGLSRLPIGEQIKALLLFWKTEGLAASQASLENAALDLSYFGPVGKAVWYVKDKADPQFKKELERFAINPTSEIGNHYLFYIVGTLAANGYELGFVREAGQQNKKTPDLWAEKSGKRIWIEANAKQPVRTIDSAEREWQLIRDIIAEKKQKFSEAIYNPGLIVADVTPIAHRINRPGTFGTAPMLKINADCCEPLGGGGLICRLYNDPDWASRPENRDNVFAFLVQEFAANDRSKYHLEQCLVTVSRRVVRDGNNQAFPRQHQLVVAQSSETSALTELSRSVYVV